MFINFNGLLYYFMPTSEDFDGAIYEYDGTTWGDAKKYIPEHIINRSPDGTTSVGDVIDNFSLITGEFHEEFDSDGSSTQYHLSETDLDEDYTPRAIVDEEEWTYDPNLATNKTFKIDFATGIVTFKPAPSQPQGTNNVDIYVSKTIDGNMAKVVNNKFWSAYGGNNNSRLFVAGSGDSMYRYSTPEEADGLYFDEASWEIVGNSADDITGFGKQYNVLIVFKPQEIYSVTYYIQSSSTTTEESQYGLGAFKSQLVNDKMGCDVPDSIQLINNQLTWASTINGVCTLVSTNIIDERNVRQISRNIERTNNLGVVGLLDWEDLKNAHSVDYDGKYILANETSGYVYVWDYAISPYANSGYVEKDAKD